MTHQFPKFRDDTRAPAPAPPANSCDCQVHVFGDPRRYPLRKSGAYPPPEDATFEAARRMHRALGVERGVVVQATVHGTNHAILLDALAGQPNYRGVAIVDDSVSDRDLQRLHDAGVRGARFNFWKFLNIVPTPAEFERSIDRTELYTCEELLLCGTGAQISPVVEVDRRPVGNGKVGEFTQELQNIYFGAVRGDAPKFKDWTIPVY